MSDPFTPWPPSEAELAWLAGLLEGEGSFFQDKSGAPSMSIGMTDEDVIARVAKMLGVSYQPLVRGNHKAVYKIFIHSRARAGRIMSSLYRLMGERRQRQIEAALRFPEADANEGS